MFHLLFCFTSHVFLPLKTICSSPAPTGRTPAGLRRQKPLAGSRARDAASPDAGPMDERSGPLGAKGFKGATGRPVLLGGRWFGSWVVG